MLSAEGPERIVYPGPPPDRDRLTGNAKDVCVKEANRVHTDVMVVAIHTPG